MKTLLVISAALWLVPVTALSGEDAAPKARPGALDGVLKRGRLAAGKSTRHAGARAATNCTGMWLEGIKGAARNARAVRNGVELLLTSTDPAVAEELRAEAPAYYARKKGTDCGCCPAAVPGAKTKVKKVSGGVKVIITAGTPEAVSKLRELAGLKADPVKEKEPAPGRP